jgi:polyhydroxyalkanoate synthase
VRRAGQTDPALAAKALRGLAAYQKAPRDLPRRERPILTAVGGCTLRDCGGEGAPIVLVPSLINPPNILDLDPRVSLAEALRPAGRVLLLDWGPAAPRGHLDLGGHLQQLLLPLLGELRTPPCLIGYCLGGTLALAAATLTPVRAVATLASPWSFRGYGPDSRKALLDLWQTSRASAAAFGALPIEVLQSAFWSLDPHRLVLKFGRFADLPAESDEARRFVSLEDWANGGEPLPLPAARELVEDLFAADLPGSGGWTIGGRHVRLPSVPQLHFTASHDLIVPALTVAPGEQRPCSSGHVGMIVGRDAPVQLHQPMREWLARVAAPG